MKPLAIYLICSALAITYAEEANASGACCHQTFGEWECVETVQILCEDFFDNGVWQGEGTTCDDVNCYAATGSCCFSGICQVLTELECTAAGGNLWTEGTDCNDETNPCGELVACCYGSSCENEWLWYCDENGGDVDGDSFCGPETCQPIGACCYGTGWCDDGVTSWACQEYGGNWVSGSCDEAYCMRGTCCLREGGCNSNMFYDECHDSFGIWQGYPLDGCGDEQIDCAGEILVVGPLGNPDADYSKIHQAVNAAEDGAFIWVMPGVYTRNNASEPVVNTMGKAITIKGWGSSDECIVDGLGINQCVYIPFEAAERPRLSSLTFRNGLADEGGGLNSLGPVMIEDCRFEYNTATNVGGGIRLIGDGGYVRNCAFVLNTAAYGGGLYASEGMIDIRNTNFEDNTATERGGAIRLYECSADIRNCTFSSNSAVQGGAMHAQGTCIPEIQNSLFSINMASSLGGAVCNTGGADSIYKECEFTGNSATGTDGGQGSGGAIFNDSSSPVFDTCRIHQNTATTYGGGMYNWYATPVIENDSLSPYYRILDNTSTYGGGIFSFGDGPSLHSIVLCGNMPDQIGGQWEDLSENCLAESCDSDDGDHTPDDCQANPCPGDTDGSNDVNIDDLLVVLAEFGTCTDNCDGDVDSNGLVNIDDLLIVIGNFGPCP